MTKYVTYDTGSYRVSQFVWFLFWLLQVLLLFRFFLRLIGANAGAGFTDFIYAVTAPLVAPFDAVIRSTATQVGVFEWATFLAMFAYWFLAWAIVKLLFISHPVQVAHAQEDEDQVIYK